MSKFFVGIELIKLTNLIIIKSKRFWSYESMSTYLKDTLGCLNACHYSW